MISEIITPAPSRGFTTVQALKARIDTGSTPDELLQQDIEAWSLRLEALIGRTLALERVVQIDYGKALGVLIAERRPIVEVHSLALGTSVYPSHRYSLDAMGGGMINIGGTRDLVSYLMGDDSPGLGHYQQNGRYVTEYTAGFVLPGWDAEIYGPRTLPVDLELAVIDAVGGRFGEAQKALAGIKSERLGDWARTYSDSVSETGAPASFAAIAAQYRSPF